MKDLAYTGLDISISIYLIFFESINVSKGVIGKEENRVEKCCAVALFFADFIVLSNSNKQVRIIGVYLSEKSGNSACADVRCQHLD